MTGAKSVAVVQVRAIANAHSSALEEISSGICQAQLKSPPVDDQTNKALLALVAEAFSRPKCAVTIKSSGSGRLQRVCIEEV